MKITIETAELAKALYRVQGIADKKSTMPILAHVLLVAGEGNTLTVSATDNDLGLTATYQADVQTPGKVAVHARQLYDIIKSISADTVEMARQDNHWIDIKAGSSRFHLVGVAADEYPALAEHEHIRKVAVSGGKLAQMIDRTLFCVSTDENRHNLSGIYCEAPATNNLRMVSTDGHRLAMAEGEFDADVHLPKSVIVPRKGFHELKRILSDIEPEATVEVGFSENSAVFRVGMAVLTTRLIEGQFPDYEQVIPKTANRQVKIGRVAFSDALRRVSLLSQGRAYGVRFEFSEDILKLIAEDPEFGDAQESLQVDYKGEVLVIGFNARYILDVLALIPEQGVSFDLSDDLSPGIIRPLEDRHFLAVVMPMRI